MASHPTRLEVGSVLAAYKDRMRTYLVGHVQLLMADAIFFLVAFCNGQQPFFYEARQNYVIENMVSVECCHHSCR